jgi:hypothetical protein
MGGLKGAYDDLSLQREEPPPSEEPSRTYLRPASNDEEDLFRSPTEPLLSSSPLIPAAGGYTDFPSLLGDDNDPQIVVNVVNNLKVTIPEETTANAETAALTANQHNDQLADAAAAMPESSLEQPAPVVTTPVRSPREQRRHERALRRQHQQQRPVHDDDEEDEMLERLLASAQQSRSRAATTNRPQRRRPRGSMQRLYNACSFCYWISMLSIVLVFGALLVYFPSKPVYNICNDKVAWTSLIDNMASAKAAADIEILASIENRNHFPIALDAGRGSFKHDGELVGTFDIPPVVADAMSITDLLIVAHLTPERWQALSISTEYYRGKLILGVDAHATIRLPAFFNFVFTTSLQDLIVHVNELSDRHLCACPTWQGASSLDAAGAPWIENVLEYVEPATSWMNYTSGQ